MLPPSQRPAAKLRCNQPRHRLHRATALWVYWLRERMQSRNARSISPGRTGYLRRLTPTRRRR